MGLGLTCIAVAYALHCSSDRIPEPTRQTSQAANYVPDASCLQIQDGSYDAALYDAGIVALNSTSIRDGTFVHWVQQVPHGLLSNVFAAIAAGNNTSTINALNLQLDTSTNPITDMTDELTLLSVAGQLRGASTITPLSNIIWNASSVMNCIPDAGVSDAGGDIPVPNCDAMIRARATEILAYVEIVDARHTSLNDILHIAQTHTIIDVRRAAMDSYLFNKGDTAAAKSMLASVVSAADAKYVDIVRFTAHMDGGTFDTGLTNFYALHASEMPPLPDAGPYDGGVTDSSCH